MFIYSRGEREKCECVNVQMCKCANETAGNPIQKVICYNTFNLCLFIHAEIGRNAERGGVKRWRNANVLMCKCTNVQMKQPAIRSKTHLL